MFEIIFDSRKGDSHHDITIVISVINLHSEVDSYYLCIDSIFMPDQETVYKVEKCLRLMISSWVTTIERVGVNEVVYLPYDFSDQYIGVLKVKKKSNSEIYLGSGHTTRYCGYEIYPSKDTTLFLNEEEFVDDGEEVILSKDILVDCLSNALRVL